MEGADWVRVISHVLISGFGKGILIEVLERVGAMGNTSAKREGED